MSIGSQATEQKFQFPKEVVLEALKDVLPSIGMPPAKIDMFIGRIEASAGLSAFSWGERISIVVDEIDPGASIVRIESSLKVGGNLPGNHRHHKNFSNIIFALSEYLHRGEKGELKTHRAILDEKLSRKDGSTSGITSVLWICLVVGVVSYFVFS
jgi:hypothetical protein